MAASDPYRRVFEGSPQPMWVFDAKTLRFLAVNDAAIARYGYTRREFLAMTILEVRPAEDIPLALRTLVVERSGNAVHGTWRHRKKSGEIIDVEVHWTTIRFRGRKAQLVLTLDTSERRRAERGVKQLQETLERRVAERTAELEEANRELGSQMRERVRLSNQLVQVQEIERRHLARELHDEVGQTLTGLKLTLQSVARSPAAGGAGEPGANDPVARLAWAESLVDTLMKQIRELSLTLRPSVLDDLGLLPALLWLVARYTAHTGVRVAFSHVDVDERLPSEIETAAFRIVQEALTNVARHAGVREARLWVRRDGQELCLIVEDDGCGFTPDRLTAEGSGVMGMRDRAEMLGGQLIVESSPQGGTRVTAILPVVRP